MFETRNLADKEGCQEKVIWEEVWKRYSVDWESTPLYQGSFVGIENCESFQKLALQCKQLVCFTYMVKYISFLSNSSQSQQLNARPEAARGNFFYCNLPSTSTSTSPPKSTNDKESPASQDTT